MMRRGYSRDHRPDCEQLVLALIVNQDGFPFSYELFDGNRADVSTVETILRTVERKHGKARRVWIFDRRSEEHTSELQSHLNLVCRLMLEKKKPTTALSDRG